MDIRNVANQRNVERAGDRTNKSATRVVVIPSVPRDEANISAAGRETAAAVESLAERARNSDRDRTTLVANAMKKLLGGELDDEATVRATAQRLLDNGFLSV